MVNASQTRVNKISDEENKKLKSLLPMSRPKEVFYRSAQFKTNQSKGDGNRDPKRRKTDESKAEIDSRLGFLVDTDTIEEIADPMEPKYCFCK